MHPATCWAQLYIDPYTTELAGTFGVADSDPHAHAQASSSLPSYCGALQYRARVEVTATVGFLPHQMAAIRQLQRDMPGRFLGPLADWLVMPASTYRAHDIAKLISASYEDKLKTLLVADQATQDIAMARIPDPDPDGSLEIWRLDHVRSSDPAPFLMPHEWVISVLHMLWPAATDQALRMASA